MPSIGPVAVRGTPTSTASSGVGNGSTYVPESLLVDTVTNLTKAPFGRILKVHDGPKEGCCTESDNKDHWTIEIDPS